MGTGALSALWTLLIGISSFKDVSIDKDNHFPKLAVFSIVLGVLYTTVCAIEIFGIVAAVTQRLPLVMAYATASVVSCLVVVAAGLMGVVIHFVDKGDLIKECTTLSTGDTVVLRFGGIFGSSSSDTLSPSEAASFCQSDWDHASWSNIISFLLETLLGVLFSLIAVAYYRQCLDPTSATNAFRAPSNQTRTGNMYPDHYNPPYSTSLPNLEYGNGPSAYAPPPGPPPRFNASDSADDLGKPPGYDRGEYTSKADEADKGDNKENLFSDFEGTSIRGSEDHDRYHV